MESYDVVIVGGFIAGLVAGRYLAEAGKKPCSGIQFGSYLPS